MSILGAGVFAALLALALACGLWASLAGERYYRLAADRGGDGRIRLDERTAASYESRPWLWLVAGGPRMLQARLDVLATLHHDPTVEDARRLYLRRRRIATTATLASLVLGIPSLLRL